MITFWSIWYRQNVPLPPSPFFLLVGSRDSTPVHKEGMNWKGPWAVIRPALKDLPEEKKKLLQWVNIITGFLWIAAKLLHEDTRAWKAEHTWEDIRRAPNSPLPWYMVQIPECKFLPELDLGSELWTVSYNVNDTKYTFEAMKGRFSKHYFWKILH